MCLGELAEVVELASGPRALVRSAGRLATVSLLALDEPLSPGDWVVCHSGFALSRVAAEEAREAASIRARGTFGAALDSHTTMKATTTEDAP